MTAKIINRLIMILITAALMLLILLEWNLSPVRVLFAIALTTVLPGYALTSAIFANTPLGIMEKFAFSCGFSLGMTSLGGLLLNYTPWGVQLVMWVVLLGGVSLVASVVALARITNSKDADLKVDYVPLRSHEIILLVLAVVIMSGAFLYARVGAENRSLSPSTRVWMHWSNDTQTEVVLGVQNQEAGPMQYRLELSTLYGQVQDWPIITLAAGAIWETHYETPPVVAETDFVKATLYRLDIPGTIYREVYLRRVSR